MWKVCIFVLLLGAATGAIAARPQPAPPQQRFDARADVVLVDVSVVDGDGRPVTGLSASDFELSVNGLPRAIQNVQYLSTLGTKTTAETNPRESQSTTNDARSSGRLLLIAVDESHLRIGGARGVLQTTERLLERIAPGDLVGLARLPAGLGGVEFTTDHNRVRRALERVTGRQPSRPMNSLRVSEGWAFESGDRFTWDRVLERECGAGPAGGGAGSFAGGMNRQACIGEQEAEAKSVVADAATRGMQSIRVLEGLMERLKAMGAPITVVLISEGLFVARDRSDLTLFARRAAEARVTLHIVQPGGSMFDYDKPEGMGSGMREDDLIGEGLEIMAGHTRGTHFKVNITNGAGAFERISRELTGYYLLAFEPTEADRASRDRRIKVDVKRRGVSVRARSTYALPDAPAAVAASPEDQVKQLLIAPLPTSGLPIRVATYAATSASGGRVRVVVSAEVGEAAGETAEWPVGMLVIDKDEQFVVNTIGPMKLAPASPRTESPRLLLNSILLEPGEYTLRLAVVGPDGRAGSVHHVIDARLKPAAGSLLASDLILSATPAAPGDAPRPTPSGVIDGEALTAAFELSGTDMNRLGRARATIEIAESATGPAMVSVPGLQGVPASGAQRAFAATITLGLLPPGEYVARALLTVPGQDDTRFTRAFRAAPSGPPRASAAASGPVAPGDPDAAPAPPPPARILTPLPRFAPEDVLKPDVVSVFLNALQRGRELSPATAAVIAEARKGTFVVPPDDGTTPDGDEPARAFVRGLAALQKNQIAQAASWFQLTLKGASDFLGAAFYLGAVHAAGGRDRDAVGAWQMSLVGDGGERAYPMLVDALLRVGDAQAALDLIAEAPDAWATDNARRRRVAVAQAMLGQYSTALETVTALLRTYPDDLDLLFVALQVLYRRHTDEPLAAEDRQRFADYAARYAQQRGPQAALVASWRKYLTK